MPLSSCPESIEAITTCNKYLFFKSMTAKFLSNTLESANGTVSKLVEVIYTLLLLLKICAVTMIYMIGDEIVIK